MPALGLQGSQTNWEKKLHSSPLKNVRAGGQGHCHARASSPSYPFEMLWTEETEKASGQSLVGLDPGKGPTLRRSLSPTYPSG